MNIDLGSLAFGSNLKVGVGTPSWGTALGQSKPDYYITRDGANELVIGMASTLAEARKSGVKTLGAGMNIDEASRPVVFDEAGGIGMIGVGYQRACRKASEDVPGCFSWSDMDRIEQQDENRKADRNGKAD